MWIETADGGLLNLDHVVEFKIRTQEKPFMDAMPRTFSELYAVVRRGDGDNRHIPIARNVTRSVVVAALLKLSEQIGAIR